MTLTFPRTLLCMAVAASLSACTLFPERPANRIFQLPAPAIAKAADAKQQERTLRVGTPQAENPINSARILVSPGGNRSNEIQAYQGVRWSNKAPVLVRNHLIEAFRRDGRLATVITDTSPARSDLTLAGHLTAFQSEYQDGAPFALIRLDIQLIDERTRNTLASKRFEHRHPATGEEVEAVVEAFGEASGELAREVVDWTLEQ
ncbi:ABC-type transport auxiliary lipoprotein family protein [Marinobacter sp. 71-i]|uniref:ABC-type transport auxiliary lipoprotein family protein n=1 Tax=Marinobacter iranensis TaxID=2962607 RepID=A0ABT5YAB5_9GAMM|nr:ABC-type transport auxiliary lipoprotein family protein [Marinobacter iranensis]MDF0750579.1 ABC-type transport auxiliary lipoprotein family protein [Marinobacter iranensis]